MLRSPLVDPQSRARLARARRLLLVLDLDGTLVALRRSPELVRVPAPVRLALQACRRAPGCRVAILSGRSLRDVQRLLRVRGIVLAGNHGYEIAGPWGCWRHPRARQARPVLRRIVRALRRSAGKVSGVLIEDKRLTVSVHYRRVAARRRARVVRAIHATVQPWVRRGAVRLGPGKRVIEVRPALAWGKGYAVRWIRRRLAMPPRHTVAVIIGDDHTDEEAFRMHRDAVTIVVGSPRRRSAAKCCLQSPRDVVRFLRAVMRLRADHA